MNEKLIPFDFASTRIVRVEVSSPGRTRAGRPYYAVHSVTAEGERCCTYDDEDLARAFEVASDCAVDDVPVVDLVGHGQARH